MSRYCCIVQEGIVHVQEVLFMFKNIIQEVLFMLVLFKKNMTRSPHSLQVLLLVSLYHLSLCHFFLCNANIFEIFHSVCKIITTVSKMQYIQFLGSYLSSFLQNTLKSNQVEINTDSRTLKPVAKLREPRELFALPKELDCPQQAARWPTECQV